ncbi:MAG: DUF2797 domain-containing protein [Candidatus Heimdallarchaeota archaeon]|nr:DUF2797 domain-containing protein [Candidatus Heimdallarchaeota archaeon]
MAVIKFTTNNRILTFGHKEYYSLRSVIKRYLWKVEGDAVHPYLLVDAGDGSSYSIRLEGKLYLDLGERFCQLCGELIPPDSSDAICKTCFESQYYKCRRCIFEGPGEPFGRPCSKDNPPCQSRDNTLRCYGQHYLYIGRFGNLLKVGTSYAKRYDGSYYRLIEQGLNEAIVIKGFPSLEKVLLAEKQLSEHFNYRTVLTYLDKIEQLQQDQQAERLEINWHALADEILEIFPEVKVSYIDLTNFWPQRKYSFPIKTVWNPVSLQGEAVYAQGNILVLEEQKANITNYLGINLSRLIGFEIFTQEDFYLDTLQESQIEMNEEGEEL